MTMTNMRTDLKKVDPNTGGWQLPPTFAGWKRADFEAFAPIAWEREQLAKAARRQRVADRAAKAAASSA